MTNKGKTEFGEASHITTRQCGDADRKKDEVQEAPSAGQDPKGTKSKKQEYSKDQGTKSEWGKGVYESSCECLICKGHFDPTCATTVECAGIGDHETALPKSAWWHPVFVMMSSWDSTSWCDLCLQWQLAYWDLYTVGTIGSFITDTARSNTLLRNNQRCDQPTNGDLYRPAVD